DYSFHLEGSTSKDYYISWYLQKSDEPPKLLIYFTTMKPSVASRMSGSFHSGGNGLDFTLTTLLKIKLEDAGDYYCLSYHEISSVFTQ
uniref:Immunoglobulin V-set domain-containing protein n=1 Tax=Sinocyclocheilus rhinocerous TaxID=307959 RepID=A0A673G7T4_9TELE